MRKKWISLTLLFTLLFSFLLTPLKIYGKEIDITGNTAQDAKVTTSSGEDVTGDNNLDRYDNYEITYNWSIPNGTNIQNGDTASFTIPNNVQIMNDTSFEVKTSDGEVIGTFIIKKGQRVGTLTFNSYLSQHPMTNIHGTLSIWGNGTVDQTYEQSELHKAGWIDGNNQPTWDILYNPNSEHRTNVVITDTLLGPQKLDPNSIQVSLGKADAQGNFTGTVDPSIKPIIEGNKFIIKIPDLNQAVQIVYHSTPTSSGQVNIDNKVSGKSDQLKVVQVGASLTVGGSGTAGGVIPISSDSNHDLSSSPETTESFLESNINSSEIYSSEEKQSDWYSSDNKETSSSSYPNHKDKDANTISGDLPQTGTHSTQEWIFFGLVCVTLAVIGWITLEKRK